MKAFGLPNITNTLLNYLNLYGGMTPRPTDRPPVVPKYTPGALANLPSGPPATVTPHGTAHPAAGIFGTSAGTRGAGMDPNRDIDLDIDSDRNTDVDTDVDTDTETGASDAHAIHARAVGPMNDVQRATLGLSTEDILRTYFKLALNYDGNKYVWFKDYDIFLKDVFTGRIVSGVDKATIDKLRTATHNSADLARNFTATRNTLAGKYTALTSHIDACILEARDRAIGPVAAGQSPNPYFVTPDGILRQAQARQAAAERARFDDGLKSIYAPGTSQDILGADLQRTPELFGLSRGTMVFKGQEGKNNALNYAPRAHHVSRHSGLVSVSTTHFGPLNIRNDQYAPTQIKYEDMGFVPGRFSLYEDRYKVIMLYGDEFSTDKGVTWSANPFPTTPEQETAKYVGAHSLIKAATERISQYKN